MSKNCSVTDGKLIFFACNFLIKKTFICSYFWNIYDVMSIILKRDFYSNEIKNFKKILDDNKDQTIVRWNYVQKKGRLN
jgi:hypothetical protein